MILRRVIAHFRKQEWTAIAIDFLIVVLGVFIGIQVNGWNEGRELRSREATYLDLLREDVAAMKNNLDSVSKRADGLQSSMLRALRALETCAGDATIGDDFRRTFTEYQNILSIQTLDATYNVRRGSDRRIIRT